MAGEGGAVGGKFPPGGETFPQPGQGGQVEVACRDGAGEDVLQRIVAARVLALVAEDRGKLALGQRGGEPGGDQHTRAERAIGDGERGGVGEHDKAAADPRLSGGSGQPGRPGREVATDLAGEADGVPSRPAKRPGAAAGPSCGDSQQEHPGQQAGVIGPQDEPRASTASYMATARQQIP